jgi:branched-subunit amino acid transport protein
VSASTNGTIVLVGVAIGVYALKSAAPLVLGGRPLPRWLDQLANVAPAALLAALVVASTLADGRRLAVDARLAGVVVAGLALWRKAGFIVTVLLAVATTAAVRALS